MSVYTTPKSPFWQFEYQRSGHRFHGAFNGKDGRPEIRRERPRREAQDAEALLKARTRQPTGERARITLHDAMAAYWLDVAQHFASKAAEWGRLRNIERLIGKHKYVDELTDADVSQMVAKRRGETARNKKAVVANRTVNGDVETLARVLKHTAKSKKYRMPAPITWADHKLATPRERIRSLTTTEDADLFKAIDAERPDFRDMVEFALLSGKRLSEVIFLEKAKVDRRAMTARVIQKGGEEIVIALTGTLLAIIERNWMHHATRVFTYVTQANRTFARGVETVVVRKGNRRPFTKNGWRKPWKAILKKAGITDFRFHDLRHTAGTRVLAATGNLKAVQDALGHADIASSARYAHTFADQRRAALEAAERLRAHDNHTKGKETEVENSGGAKG